jgi:hypothetical protein
VLLSGDLVIAQVYAAGVEGGPVASDYVVVFNRGPAPVSLDGKNLAALALGGSSWQAVPLASTLQPGQSYLVRFGGFGPGTSLPFPDATGAADLSLAGGTLELVNGPVPPSGPPAGGPALLDLVGYGPVPFFEGSGPAPAPGTAALLRLGDGYTDTDSNAADFVAGDPAPQGTQDPPDLPVISLSDEHMLIGKWDFPTQVPDEGQYPYVNVVNKPAYRYSAAMKKWVYDWSGAPTVSYDPANSPKGQNNANPRGDFPDHALVKIGGVYSDPSYGVTSSSLADFQTRAVAGFDVTERQRGLPDEWHFRKAPSGGAWLEVKENPV